jgi:PPOX class probable F420-dependent enzyme
VIPESRRHILKTNALAHLATLGADGEVQSTPVWFDWDGEQVVMNTNKWRKKYRNMTGHPRVAVSIADPDEPIHYVELRGNVEMEDDPDQAVINSLSQKYMGQDYAFLRPGEERVTVKLRPDHVSHQ